MIWLLDLIHTWRVNRRLTASLKPNPDYRKRRLAQFSPERRKSYMRATEGLCERGAADV